MPGFSLWFLPSCVCVLALSLARQVPQRTLGETDDQLRIAKQRISYYPLEFGKPNIQASEPFYIQHFKAPFRFEEKSGGEYTFRRLPMAIWEFISISCRLPGKWNLSNGHIRRMLKFPVDGVPFVVMHLMPGIPPGNKRRFLGPAGGDSGITNGYTRCGDRADIQLLGLSPKR